MAARRARTRILLFLGAGLTTAAFVIAVYGANTLRSVELHTVDARFALRGPLPVPKNVVVVAIDARSFDQLNAHNLPNRWPWPRRYHATLLKRIAAGHPKAIAFDVQFTEPSDSLDDSKLISAVAQAGHVVLATTEVDSHGNTNVFGGGSVVKEIGARVGNASLPTDPDGVIRHVPQSVDGLETFGLVTADVAAGHKVPWPGGSSQWVNFAGPPGRVKTYSYSDVYFGKVPASAFTGKIVVIGPAAPSLQDVHATSASGSQWMPGAEVQANIAATALDGFPLRNAPGGAGIALIVFFALLPALVSLRLRALWVPVVSLVAGGLFALATQVAFDHGTVLLFVYPLTALAISTVACIVIWYVLEAIERALTRDVFARFVPEAVVDEVLKRTGGELRLGGETVFGTVMFTDLRGFTTFSEGLDAQRVIGLLNRYLSQISDAVLEHGGTLVSYTGDGMMVVFGAPLEQPDHADRALDAALEILETRLPQFNAWLREEGFEQGFKMGIGLNSGDFMSGNVGSLQRLEYTAIGDTINTASRIEGMTKGTPYALFVADSTREALTREADLVFIDEMPVRGRKAPIKLWTVRNDSVLKPDYESEVAPKDPVAESPAEAEPAVAG
jgi:adenylate cyclase